MSRCKPLDIRELGRHPLPKVVEGDKYSHGTLLVIAGTREIAGAAAICANAALRAGSGKITIATVESVAPQLGTQLRCEPAADAAKLRHRALLAACGAHLLVAFLKYRRKTVAPQPRRLVRNRSHGEAT